MVTDFLITFQITYIFCGRKKSGQRLSSRKNTLNYDKILLEKWCGNRISDRKKKNEELLLKWVCPSIFIWIMVEIKMDNFKDWWKF